MNWMSLNPVEAAALWAGLAAVALWLYLHHRRPLRRKVSTLRFWSSVQAVSQPRRIERALGVAGASAVPAVPDFGIGKSPLGRHV